MKSLEQVSREYILSTLAYFEGSVSETAYILKISRSKVYKTIEKQKQLTKAAGQTIEDSSVLLSAGRKYAKHCTLKNKQAE